VILRIARRGRQGVTYRPSTDQDPSTWHKAALYLEEAGLARGGTIQMADALYALVGGDLSRVKTALAVLDLVEAALAAEEDFVVQPELDDLPAKIKVGDDYGAEILGGDLGDACRRLLEALGSKP